MSTTAQEVLDKYIGQIADGGQPAPNDPEGLKTLIVSQGNKLKTIELTSDAWTVANYIVLFGSTEKKDLHGEFFTKHTVLGSPYVTVDGLLVDFEHGLDVDSVIGLKRDDILGKVNWKTAETDNIGVFVQRVLDRQNRYLEALRQAEEAGLITLGSSSEAISGRTKRSELGEILVWPLRRDSLTVTPAQPENVDENRIRTLKTVAGDHSDEVFQFLKAVLIPATGKEHETALELKEVKERLQKKRAEVSTQLLKHNNNGGQ